MQDIEDLYIKAASEGSVEQLKDIDKKHRINLGTVMYAMQISLGDYKTYRYLFEAHRNNIPQPMLKSVLNGAVEYMALDENIDGLKWAISQGGERWSQKFGQYVKLLFMTKGGSLI